MAAVLAEAVKVVVVELSEALEQMQQAGSVLTNRQNPIDKANSCRHRYQHHYPLLCVASAFLLQKDHRVETLLVQQ